MVPPLKSILNRDFLSMQVGKLALPVAKSISADTPILEAISLFINEKYGAAIIHDSKEPFAGIVTERDFVKDPLLENPLEYGRPVSDLMTRKVETVKSTASVAKALYYMSVGHYRHVPIVAPDKYLMLSVKDLIDFLHRRLTKKIVEESINITFDENLVDEFFASEVRVLALDPALFVDSSDKVSDALTRMRDGRQGVVVIQNQFGGARGIFTERDYLRKVLGADLPAKDTMLSTVFTADPRTVLKTTTIAYAFELLSGGGFRHLPVVDEQERVVGVISVRTILNFLADAIVKELTP